MSKEVKIKIVVSHPDEVITTLTDLIQKGEVNVVFFQDYHEWPFAMSGSNEELVDSILNYDEDEGKKRIETYLDQLGSYDVGTAIPQTLKIAFGIEPKK